MPAAKRQRRHRSGPLPGSARQSVDPCCSLFQMYMSIWKRRRRDPKKHWKTIICLMFLGGCVFEKGAATTRGVPFFKCTCPFEKGGAATWKDIKQKHWFYMVFGCRWISLFQMHIRLFQIHIPFFKIIFLFSNGYPIEKGKQPKSLGNQSVFQCFSLCRCGNPILLFQIHIPVFKCTSSNSK